MYCLIASGRIFLTKLHNWYSFQFHFASLATFLAILGQLSSSFSTSLHTFACEPQGTILSKILLGYTDYEIWMSFILPAFCGYCKFFLITLLLFNYSCLHFLPTTPHHPSQTHLPPLLPPPSLITSMCPLSLFLKTLTPRYPLPTPLWLR